MASRDFSGGAKLGQQRRQGFQTESPQGLNRAWGGTVIRIRVA
jgi:hypothetical protein